MILHSFVSQSFILHSLVPLHYYEKWLTYFINVFQYGCIPSFAYSFIWNNTSFISDYVQTLWVVYIPKYHYSAITSPQNILFTCNRNRRSSVTPKVGTEFPSPCVCFTFSRTNMGSILVHFFEWSCIILSWIEDNSKLTWMQNLFDSFTYPFSVFSIYFLVKSSIISYCLTCNSCSCFKIDGKSLYGNSLLKCSVKVLKIK